MAEGVSNPEKIPSAKQLQEMYDQEPVEHPLGDRETKAMPQEVARSREEAEYFNKLKSIRTQLEVLSQDPQRYGDEIASLEEQREQLMTQYHDRQRLEEAEKARIRQQPQRLFIQKRSIIRMEYFMDYSILVQFGIYKRKKKGKQRLLALLV